MDLYVAYSADTSAVSVQVELPFDSMLIYWLYFFLAYNRVTHRSFNMYGSICGGRGGDGGGGGVPFAVTQASFPRMLWKLMSVWVLLSMQSAMASTRAVPPAMPVLRLCPLRTT